VIFTNRSTFGPSEARSANRQHLHESDQPIRESRCTFAADVAEIAYLFFFASDR
jgi:hypothetical protein